VQLLPDDQLIAGLKSKDPQIFEQLMQHWYSSMYYIASSIAGDSIADEVIQEVWISVINGIDRFEGRSSLKSWVMRITANEAKTRRRKESRSVSLEQLSESWATDPRFSDAGHWQQSTSQWHGDSPDKLMQAEELRHCLEKHIQSLPDNQKAALMMRESGAYSLDEICNILDISSSNVRVLLHRARDKMVQVIDRFEREGKC
jgi:RNA polymerase sigma-70 factor (ECF subfamily)